VNQCTLGRSVSFSGVGLHTGEKTDLTFHPAAPGAGIVFVRRDLPGAPEVRVQPSHAAGESEALRRTVLRSGAAEVHTVEHVLAALAGLGIDNARLELNGLEVPEPSDGSAAPFVALLRQAGVVEQSAAREPLVIRRPVVYQSGDVQIVGLPGEGLRLSFTLQFDNPILGTQHRTCEIAPDTFSREIAPARTFVLFRDVERLRAGGLIKGGSLQNAVVVKEDGLLNQEPLRFPDEPVRHKILDLLGDLSLLGRPLQGQVHAIRSGHAHNLRFVRQLEREHAPGADLATMLEQVHFDIGDIERIMPHRYPMLLVDRILFLRDRQRVVGLKNVTINEPFFIGHFPGHPIMPAVLIIEAMAQVGGVLLLNTVEDPSSKLVYFMGIDNARFRRPVRPGDQLIFDLQLVRLKSRTCQMTGRAFVQGQLVAEADLLSTIVDRENPPR
jgi:UDP-3-O-[3-hydroxymyristoyl] N-acetylglucosamine deacetylase/3-hydroxyacyl-[acyl-carrier-protein] dehydratase